MTTGDRRLRVALTAAAVLAAAVTVTGFGVGTSNPTITVIDGTAMPSSADTAAPSDLQAMVDGDALRIAAQIDFEPLPSVVAVAERAHVAVAGKILSWHDGRTIRDGDELLHYAVAIVTVTADFEKHLAGDQLGVEIPCGGTIVDDNGEAIDLEDGARYALRSVVELEQAAPVGTDLIVLAEPAPTAAEIAAEPDRHEARVGAAVELATTAWPLPQGLVLADADGSVVNSLTDDEYIDTAGWHRAASSPDGFVSLIDELARQEPR